METSLGASIKGYDVRERIGGGGMGDVFRAYQSTIGREVAIKIIKPALANQPDFIRRFDTEAQLVARLEHPHIVPLFDYWRDPTGAYLVMRLLRGGSLADALAQGAYDLESTANLLDQIASALTVAHRSNVVHRDIKPANILLDEDGNAYLTDFGIAKELETDAAPSTSPDGFIGSPDYLSPEQARNDSITTRADIYSLGVVLYETLTGQHPFPELSAVKRLFAHLNEPVPDITTLDEQLAPAINAVVQRATAKNPAHRYADVTALALAFREAAALRISRIEPNLVELLTPREQEVLHLLVEGKSNREIAAKLTVELATVKWYIYHLYQKLNVRSRVQAIVKARELNLIVSDFTRTDASTTGLGAAAEPQNPFKGLRAFQSADEQDFFGRERLVKRLLKRLGEKDKLSRFLAVIGPSGSGKSSLVKAGLIPSLWRGEMPGSEKWFVAEMTPGSHPLDEMEVALVRVATRHNENLREQLARDERGLVRAAQIVLPNDDSELLLIVDQFEEAFTLLEDESERQHFLNLIHAAVTDPRSRTRVIVTLRADFYDRPLHYAEFGQLIQVRSETVLPMGAEELEQAIVKPARRVGVKFEEGLVASIVAEVNYQPGALPLLQYALTELFDNQENHYLTRGAYQKIGGTTGALASRAEEIYNEAGDVYREAMRQMFLRLVTLGEGIEDTRRRVPRSELLAVAADPDVMDEVIDTFTAYRLLALDHDPATRKPTVEVAHEALLREWERLRGWLNESRADIRLQRQLAGAAQEWREAEKDTSFLLREARLDLFESWSKATDLALTAFERDYLQSSLTRRGEEQAAEAVRQARETKLEKRAQTVLRTLVGVFAVAALVSGGLAIWANEQRQEALRQASMGLAAQSRLETIEGHPDRGVLLALEALENYPYTWQAERALFGAVTENRLLSILDGHTAPVWYLAWSPDETRLATASEDGTSIIWDTETGEALYTLRHDAWINKVDWSPDGTRIATASDDMTAAVWDAQTGERIALLEGHEDWVPTAQFSPDGQRVLTSSGDGTARVWDAEIGANQLVLSGHTSTVIGASWSPDGSRIATASNDGTAHIWDASNGVELNVLVGHEDQVAVAEWSPNGKRIATASRDGTARVWDAATGEQILLLEGAGRGALLFAIWSPDGAHLLTTERGFPHEGVVTIWDMITGEQVYSHPAWNSIDSPASWSSDGSRVAFIDETGALLIWDAATGDGLLAVPGFSETNWLVWSSGGTRLALARGDIVTIWDMTDRPVFTYTGQNTNIAEWSADGKWFLRADQDGPLSIVDNQTGQTVKTLPFHAGEWDTAAWSPDGTLIAGTQGGTLLIWDAASGEERLNVQLEGASESPRLNVIYWSPDGSRLAVPDYGAETAYGNGLGYIIDTHTGQIIHTVSDEEHGVLCTIAWSPDGTRIAAGIGGASREDSVEILDASSMELMLTFGPVFFPCGFNWSPDGSRLLVPTLSDGTTYIVDAATGEILLTDRGHVGGVRAGVWSPNGARVATYGDDNVRIWDPKNGANYGVLNASAWNGRWSPDGTRLATRGPGGVLQIWRVFPNTNDLIAYTRECCVLRELTAEERRLFGLPPAPGQSPTPTPEATGGAALPLATLSFGLAAVGLVTCPTDCGKCGDNICSPGAGEKWQIQLMNILRRQAATAQQAINNIKPPGWERRAPGLVFLASMTLLLLGFGLLFFGPSSHPD